MQPIANLELAQVKFQNVRIQNPQNQNQQDFQKLKVRRAKWTNKSGYRTTNRRSDQSEIIEVIFNYVIEVIAYHYVIEAKYWLRNNT